MSEPGLTDEQRWERARQLVAHGPDEAALQDIRDRRRRGRWLVGSIVAASLVVGVGVGVLAAALTGHHHQQEDTTGLTWQTVVGGAVNVFSLVLIVAGIMWLARLRRSGRLPRRWSSPTQVLTRQQRRSVGRQLAGKDSVDPTNLSIVRNVARNLQVQLRPYGLLYSGVLLDLVGCAIQLSIFNPAFALVLGVLFAVYALLVPALVIRQARLASRFLREHPAAG